MPVDIRFQAPFVPQEGITSQILTAIQLANENHFRRQQLALQQQQLATTQEKTQADIAESNARAGLYGSEAQKNQLLIDNMKRTQQLFAPTGQPEQPAAVPPPARTSGATPVTTYAPGSPEDTAALAQAGISRESGPWIPQGTPPQLAPVVGQMIPQDLSEEEKPIIESAASAGAQKARETGMASEYFQALNKGITDVSNRRLQLAAQPTKQPLTDADRTQFKETVLPSFENLSPAQKKLASSAIDGAKSQQDKEALTQRLMAMDGQALQAKVAQANRVSNENLQHNLQLDKDGRDKIIAANTKWADAQTQLNVGIKGIQAAADGNDLMTRLVPTMEVLGINMTGGIKRISPTEYQAAEIPASWANRFNSWVDRVTTGGTTPEMVKEGKQLFSTLADARYSTYLAEQKSTVSNYNMKASDVSVIDNNGQSVTLDKALKGGTKPAKSEAAAPAAAGGLSPEAKAYLKSQGLPVPE